MIYGESAAQNDRILDLNHITCNNCENQKVLQLHCYTKHIHVMFIPFVTAGKKAIIICSNCGKEYDVSNQSDTIKELVKIEKEHIRIPIWHFSGLAIVALIALSSITYNMWDNEQDAQLVKNPQAGDLYEYKDGAGWYSTFKISQVDKDSVYVFYNMQSINQASAIDEIDKPDSYWPFEESMSREELEQMYEDGEIYEIDRD
ncbi:MAG: zinc ribbon domain-containing protein [Flavobacteriales bacterium]|nr:zinc ribbon domain-containing protein [Flavobacteriales bacterium]